MRAHGHRIHSFTRSISHWYLVAPVGYKLLLAAVAGKRLGVGLEALVTDCSLLRGQGQATTQPAAAAAAASIPAVAVISKCDDL